MDRATIGQIKLFSPIASKRYCFDVLHTLVVQSGQGPIPVRTARTLVYSIRHCLTSARQCRQNIK